jgi:hypothetical protein
MFDRLLELRNDLGLLSEEYDPVLKRQVGNFPQAFSHVSLVNTACRLSGQHELGSAEGRGDDERRRTVAALGAPLVALGKVTRQPWRMWGSGRIEADDRHPHGQRLHVRRPLAQPTDDGATDGAGRSRRRQ